MDTSIVQVHYCKVKGHEKQQLLPYICSSSNCDSISRYFCQECLLECLHYHNNYKLQFFGKEQLIASVKAKIGEVKQKNLEKLKVFDEQVKSIFIIVSQIEELVQQLKKYQQQQNAQSSDQNENYFESLIKMVTEQFYQLSVDNINKILNIQEYKLNSQKIELFNKNFQQLIQTLESLKNSMSNLKVIDFDFEDLNQANIDNKIQRFIYSEQQLQDLKATQISSITFCNQKISSNNLYLATVSTKYESINKTSIWGNTASGCSRYYFDLIDLQSKKSFKLKFKNTKIDFLQFSTDSKSLYYKENNEPFYCFQIQGENFKEYSHFPELQSIKFILETKQNRAFIINKNNELQLLDMEYQYTLFQQKTQNSNSLIIDSINKTLISAGEYLEFWDEENCKKIHQSAQKQELEQLILQSSTGESKLYAFEKEYLYIFQIAYKQTEIEIDTLQKFKYEQKIVSYSLVWNHQYLVVFGEYGIITIYDQSFKMIKHFYIGSDEDKKNKQYDNGQCSNNLSAITITSNQKSRYLYFTIQKHK